MKLLHVVVVFLMVVPLVVGQETQTIYEETLVLQHVTLIDATGRPPRPDMAVVIRGGQLVSVVPSTKFKPIRNAHVVDASNKFLIPGLWDMHVHTLSKTQPKHFFPLFIASGVTGIRDMGGDLPLEQISQIKREIAAGTRLGPEIFAAGPILEGSHPFWPFSIAVNTPQDGSHAVDELIKQGADFIKVYNTLSRDSYLAIAAETKQKQIPFAGHIPDSMTSEEASRAGQKSIEHLWAIPVDVCSDSEALRKRSSDANDEEDAAKARDLFYGINQTILAHYDAVKAAKLFQEFVKNGTWQSPTLVVLRAYSEVTDPSLRNDPRMAYMPEDIRKFWVNMSGKPDPRNDAIQKELLDRDVDIVRAMHRAGVRIIAGTDTPNPYTYPGFSLHEELELLVKAGFTPLEALQAATVRAADYLGVERRYGTIEEGKAANLVLLDANPLDDIRNSRAIRAVILHGRYLDRTELDRMLAQVRENNTQ